MGKLARVAYTSPAGSVGRFAASIAAAEFLATLSPVVHRDSIRAKNVPMSHPIGAGGTFLGAFSKYEEIIHDPRWR